MTIRSMTGFAREAGASGPHQWAWEIKTVNGRNLEIRVRTPPGFEGAGEASRRALAASLTRGQCQLTLTLAKSAVASVVRINTQALQSLLDALAGVVLPAGMGPATLDGLLAVRGVVESEEEGRDAFDEVLAGDLQAGAARLVQQVQAARAREGEALAAILKAQLAGLSRLVDAADSCPTRQPEAVKARLRDQVQALLDASQVLDPARLHQEAALLATRADIREELDRLRTHIATAFELLSQGGAVGRRLDFLAQELGRETNTLCAKAGDVSLSRIGLDMKALVEQFREQVQNVE